MSAVSGALKAVRDTVSGARSARAVAFDALTVAHGIAETIRHLELRHLTWADALLERPRRETKLDFAALDHALTELRAAVQRHGDEPFSFAGEEYTVEAALAQAETVIEQARPYREFFK